MPKSDSICVECQKLDDPVTPENGVWIPDLDGRSVPVHNCCAALRTLKQAGVLSEVQLTQQRITCPQPFQRRNVNAMILGSD
jgi:hypothetical protein